MEPSDENVLEMNWHPMYIWAPCALASLVKKRRSAAKSNTTPRGFVPFHVKRRLSTAKMRESQWAPTTLVGSEKSLIVSCGLPPLEKSLSEKSLTRSAKKTFFPPELSSRAHCPPAGPPPIITTS